jgi:hypothetical protein
MVANRGHTGPKTKKDIRMLGKKQDKNTKDNKSDTEESTKKTSSAIELELSIQEDPICHGLLKKICIFESSLAITEKNENTTVSAVAATTTPGKNKKANVSETNIVKAVETASVDVKDKLKPVDKSMWDENQINMNRRVMFAITLVELLRTQSLYNEWLKCNRPCYSLLSLATVPAAQQLLIECVVEDKKVNKMLKSAVHPGSILFKEKIVELAKSNIIA